MIEYFIINDFVEGAFESFQKSRRKRFLFSGNYGIIIILFFTEMSAMKQYFEIVDVTAREVVGLKYEPTVEVEITLDDETVGRASVPAGMKNAREISIAAKTNKSKKPKLLLPKF